MTFYEATTYAVRQIERQIEMTTTTMTTTTTTTRNDGDHPGDHPGDHLGHADAPGHQSGERPLKVGDRTADRRGADRPFGGDPRPFGGDPRPFGGDPLPVSRTPGHTSLGDRRSHGGDASAVADEASLLPSGVPENGMFRSHLTSRDLFSSLALSVAVSYWSVGVINVLSILKSKSLILLLTSYCRSLARCTSLVPIDS